MLPCSYAEESTGTIISKKNLCLVVSWSIEYVKEQRKVEWKVDDDEMNGLCTGVK